MNNDIIFQKDYKGFDIIISLQDDIVKLHDTYNDHHAHFKIVDVNKYIELCRELQDYQEYDEDEEDYFDVDEVYTDDYDDGFLLYGDWAKTWRFEYFIDAIQKAGISKTYNLDDIAKLNKEELKNYSTSMLWYILNNIKEQKELQQTRPVC